MHVDALEAYRSRVQVEVDAPKGGSKGVGQARSALVIERVAFAKDQRSGFLCFWSGENGIVLWEVALDGAHGLGVVHQRALEGDARRSGTADVAVCLSA